MRWSMDSHSAGLRGESNPDAQKFWKAQTETGLRAAFDERDQHFGIEYAAEDDG